MYCTNINRSDFMCFSIRSPHDGWFRPRYDSILSRIYIGRNSRFVCVYLWTATRIYSSKLSSFDGENWK